MLQGSTLYSLAVSTLIGFGSQDLSEFRLLKPDVYSAPFRLMQKGEVTLRCKVG